MMHINILSIIIMNISLSAYLCGSVIIIGATGQLCYQTVLMKPKYIG